MSLPDVPMPVIVGLLIAAAVLIKVAGVVTVAVGGARLTRSDDTAAAGEWRLVSEPQSEAALGKMEYGIDQGLLRHALRDVSGLEVKKAPSSISVRSRNGKLMSYGTDGVSIQCVLEGGSYAKASARIEGSELHLVLRTADGAQLEERLAPDENRGLSLQSVLVLPDGSAAMSLQRSYERV